MPYYVNVPPSAYSYFMTIHAAHCQRGVADRHGPFDTKEEAALAAHVLALRGIHNCGTCGGLLEPPEKLVTRCPCAACQTR